jgi:hypothetical protein
MTSEYEDYVIAIPSYKRSETLLKRTFPLLLKYNIEPSKIHIFVANQEEKEEYEKNLEGYGYGKIIIGEVGIMNQRNFMSNYFDEGKRIFYIDDDIYEIYECINLIDKSNKIFNKLIVLDDLHKFIVDGFYECEKLCLSNWGVYVVDNPYFMKPSAVDLADYTSTKLNYIMGGFCGVINNHECEIRTMDDKEDYERSIKYYLKDGGLLRFNNVAFKTKCYKEPGGMQYDEQRTKERILESAKKLVETYPNLCKLNLKKKSGYAEVRLHDKRKYRSNSLPTVI